MSISWLKLEIKENCVSFFSEDGYGTPQTTIREWLFL